MDQWQSRDYCMLSYCMCWVSAYILLLVRIAVGRCCAESSVDIELGLGTAVEAERAGSVMIEAELREGINCDDVAAMNAG